MDNPVSNYLNKVGNYKKEFREKSLDYLQGRNDQYEESFRSKWDNILGTPSKIAAIQTVLENKLKEDKK